MFRRHQRIQIENVPKPTFRCWRSRDADQLHSPARFEPGSLSSHKGSFNSQRPFQVTNGSSIRCVREYESAFIGTGRCTKSSPYASSCTVATCHPLAPTKKTSSSEFILHFIGRSLFCYNRRRRGSLGYLAHAANVDKHRFSPRHPRLTLTLVKTGNCPSCPFEIDP